MGVLLCGAAYTDQNRCLRMPPVCEIRRQGPTIANSHLGVQFQQVERVSFCCSHAVSVFAFSPAPNPFQLGLARQNQRLMLTV